MKKQLEKLADDSKPDEDNPSDDCIDETAMQQARQALKKKLKNEALIQQIQDDKKAEAQRKEAEAQRKEEAKELKQKIKQEALNRMKEAAYQRAVFWNKNVPLSIEVWRYVCDVGYSCQCNRIISKRD